MSLSLSLKMEYKAQFYATHHDLGGRFAHGRNDADDLGRKVTSVARPLAASRAPAAAQDGLSAALRVQDDQVAFAQLQVSRSFALVVLKSHGVHGAFLQSFQEELDQISDVFRVRALEGELFGPDGAQSESLAESFARPEKVKARQLLTHTHTSVH